MECIHIVHSTCICMLTDTTVIMLIILSIDEFDGTKFEFSDSTDAGIFEVDIVLIYLVLL